MANKPIYTKQLSRIVARDAKSSGKYHIIPRDLYTWSVVPEGSIRASKIFANRANAVNFARKAAARRMFSEIIVHDINGEITRKIAV